MVEEIIQVDQVVQVEEVHIQELDQQHNQLNLVIQALMDLETQVVIQQVLQEFNIVEVAVAQVPLVDNLQEQGLVVVEAQEKLIQYQVLV